MYDYDDIFSQERDKERNKERNKVNTFKRTRCQILNTLTQSSTYNHLSISPNSRMSPEDTSATCYLRSIKRHQPRAPNDKITEIRPQTRRGTRGVKDTSLKQKVKNSKWGTLDKFNFGDFKSLVKTKKSKSSSIMHFPSLPDIFNVNKLSNVVKQRNKGITKNINLMKIN